MFPLGMVLILGFSCIDQEKAFDWQNILSVCNAFRFGQRFIFKTVTQEHLLRKGLRSVSVSDVNLSCLCLKQPGGLYIAAQGCSTGASGPVGRAATGEVGGLFLVWSALGFGPSATVYLPITEGGQGLVDLRSRIIDFRLLAVQ